MRPYYLLAIFLWIYAPGYGQSADGMDGLTGLPAHFLRKVQDKTASLDEGLTKQTEKYLQRMQRREARLRKKLDKVDSTAAKSLFSGADGQYAALAKQIATDTGGRKVALSGEYQPYADSLRGMLGFLQARAGGASGAGGTGTAGMMGMGAGGDGLPVAVRSLGGVGQEGEGVKAAGVTGMMQGASPQLAQLQQASSQFEAMQAKLQDADQAKAFIQARKQQIGDYLRQHANLSSLLGKEYQGMNQDVYYYSEQVRQYKAMLNDPDKMEKEALGVLEKLPAFQAFMKQNSQLAGLFGLPANYGTPQGMAGLQTRDMVSALIQGQVAAGGSGGAAALQSNLQSAESQLDGFKDKLGKLGGGSGDMDMPDFKPNGQKTKTFWKRLEYGANFQTTRDNYYFPTVSDLGLSVGYKLSDRSTVGVGASYKLGWGNGIQHIALSSQGAGLRSFVDIRIKGSFSATGGLEYNYTTPFASYQDLRVWNSWTKSGLIGVTKTVSMKNRFFKKTNLQLLWDFLSYQQVPKTQPVLFRVGYTF